MNVYVLKSKLDALANVIGIKARRRVPRSIDELIETVETIGTDLQDVTVRPNEDRQVITADQNHDGLGTVTVEPIKLESRTVVKDTSGTTYYGPSSGYTGIGSIGVYVQGMTLPTSVSTSSSGTYRATISRNTATRYLRIPKGYNEAAAYYTISSTPNMTLPTSASSTSSGTKKAEVTPSSSVQYLNIPTGYNSSAAYYQINAASTQQTQTKTATPTESQQLVEPDSGYLLSSVTVDAISSSYVGSGIDRRDSTDLSASGATVSVPAGYYASNASKAVSSGTEGTPTATKGNVSNHSVSVTPSVTNTAGYITGGTKTGTAVTVQASELVSGTYTVTGSGTADVTNYASASVAAGSATASATKGTVSNHAISVTPSVTRTAGWVTAGSASGTAVTVQASELVSGSETKTANGTYDVTNLAEVVVNVQGGGSGMQVATATSTPSTASASIQFTGLQGEPTSFYVTSAADLATGSSPFKVAAVVYDGSGHHAQIVTNTSNAQATYDGATMSHTYSNGTLTVTSSSHRFQTVQYKLVYTHGGNSANIGTSDVQVGSGATSITFTGLTDEPTCWSCVFKSNFSTSSGYTRAMAVVNDGASTYGMEMGSGGLATSNWTASYSNGSLTITSQSTSAGGYFHQPGYYQLTYGIGGEVEPPTIEPLTVTQNGTYAESGKAYSPVTVNVSSGGGVQYDTKTATASDYPTSLQFTGMKGEPKFLALRLNAQVSSSGSTTYYYIVDIVSNGTTTHGNCFRIGSTRRVDNIASGYSWSYSGTTLTITSSAGSRSASPGAFYSGSYELMYAY